MLIKVNSLYILISVFNFINFVYVYRFYKNSIFIKQQILYIKNKEECLGGYFGFFQIIFIIVLYCDFYYKQIFVLDDEIECLYF